MHDEGIRKSSVSADKGLKEASHGSVAESGHVSFPPSAAVLFIEHVEDAVDLSWTHLLFILYYPPGIPLKPNSVSFSHSNPYPSKCCHKLTRLVHLLVFWVHFVQVVQAKKGTCFGMQMAASACAALMSAWQTKGFQLWCHPFPAHLVSIFKVHLVWNLQEFLWSDSGL